LTQWLEKFREHGNGIALVVDRTSTGWWQDLCGHADLILQVNKKIDFLHPTNESGTNALGSSLVAYGERGVQALMNAAAAGLGTLFKPCRPVPTSAETEREADLAEAPPPWLHGCGQCGQGLSKWRCQYKESSLHTLDRECKNNMAQPAQNTRTKPKLV
jgi:hypothetical protein